MKSVRYLSALSVLSLFSSHVLAAHSSVADHWDLLTEFVYLKRNNVTGRKLAKNAEYPYCNHGCPSTVAISSNDMVNKLGWEPGVTGAIAYMPDTKSIYQASFTYVWPWQSCKVTTGDGSVSYPFHDNYFTEDYNEADKAVATYHSNFYTFDLNYWRNSARRNKDYFVFSGIFGIRYFHLQEKSTLRFVNNYVEGNSSSNYNTTGRNDVIGIQGGFDFQTNPFLNFRFDLLALAGLGLNRPYASVVLQDENNTTYIRDYHKQHSQNVVFTDVKAKIGYQYTKCMNLHAGYQMFYASGLAFSVAQYSTSTRQQNERYYRRGSMIIHGIVVGADFYF